MLTHIETQKLNDELRTIHNTIGFIANKRSQQAKEQRAKLKARQVEIYEALKDAPAEPLSPQEIWGYIERWARGNIVKETELKEKFLERFNGSPHLAMSSYAQDVVIAEYLARQSLTILEIGEKIADLTERATAILAGLNVLADQLQKEIIKESRSGFMRSTNAMGNLLTLWQIEAMGGIYEDLRPDWSGLDVNGLSASLKSWQELQVELATGNGIAKEQ